MPLSAPSAPHRCYLTRVNQISLDGLLGAARKARESMCLVLIGLPAGGIDCDSRFAMFELSQERITLYRTGARLGVFGYLLALMLHVASGSGQARSSASAAVGQLFGVGQQRGGKLPISLWWP